MNETPEPLVSTGTSAQHELATPPRRFFGQFLDSLVAYAAIFIPLAMDADALFMVGYALAILYILLADGLPGGQSLGKKVLHMRVINEQTGQDCSFGTSFLRNIPLVILGPIDWVFIFGAKRQRLGDRAARTVVVVD